MQLTCSTNNLAQTIAVNGVLALQGTADKLCCKLMFWCNFGHFNLHCLCHILATSRQCTFCPLGTDTRAGLCAVSGQYMGWLDVTRLVLTATGEAVDQGEGYKLCGVSNMAQIITDYLCPLSKIIKNTFFCPFWHSICFKRGIHFKFKSLLLVIFAIFSIMNQV